MKTKTAKEINLADAKISTLIAKFALPAILANIVSSVYNIVDQIFIGNRFGTNGTGAVGVAFPLILFMAAVYIMLGSGAASKFSLYQGEGKNDKAGRMIINSMELIVVVGIVIMVITLIFGEQLMYAFGGRHNEETGVYTLDYATEYVRIIAIGAPFQMFGAAAAMVIRADKSPTYSMICTLSGAVLNIGLDALFIIVLDMGMTGAALATIMGQIVSAAIAFAYFFRFKTLKIKKEHFRPSGKAVKELVLLGLPAGLMQIGVMAAQIVMSNMLVLYGGNTIYGESIPIAVNDVVSKVTALFSAIILGICQSCQPILGYNYGAGNYKRVQKTFISTVVISVCISVVAFILFQTIPRQILWCFNSGGEELYFEFGSRYLRIFMGAIIVSCLPIAVSNFFPSIGKPVRGMIASLSQRIIFQLPFIIIFPLIWGLDGILYAGLAADICAAILSIALVAGPLFQLGKMPAPAKPARAQATPAPAGADAHTENTSDTVSSDNTVSGSGSIPGDEGGIEG